jgi:hypothetical protein
MWLAYLEQRFEKRGRDNKVTGEWLRGVITHELGSLAPFMDSVEPGLVRVLMSARSGLSPFLCRHRSEKHLEYSRAADVFTSYIARAPIGAVLPPVPVAHRDRHVSAVAVLVRQLLARPGPYDSASGVSWSDVAVVLIVGVDGVGGDAGVSGVANRPSPLGELARVVAFCGASQSLRQHVAWMPLSVPDFGVVNVQMDTAM